MKTAKQAAAFGTWYTEDGERADAPPAPRAAPPLPASREAMTASSVHAMAGAGGGLLARVGRRLVSASVCVAAARLL